MHSPRIVNREALTGVVEEFGRVIAGQDGSVIDGKAGVRVVRMVDVKRNALADQAFDSFGALALHLAAWITIADHLPRDDP